MRNVGKYWLWKIFVCVWLIMMLDGSTFQKLRPKAKVLIKPEMCLAAAQIIIFFCAVEKVQGSEGVCHDNGKMSWREDVQ